MSDNIFTSPQSWFSLTLPNGWSEYEDEEGTYAFFNVKHWTGNFRITPFKWEQTNNPGDDKAGKYILGELNDNEGAIEIKVGAFSCAHFKKSIIQDTGEFVIYYWITGQGNNLFICSFTIDKKQEETRENKSELEKVAQIIKSIRIK